MRGHQRRPRHKDDFTTIYDLDDPSLYYNALEPADYRMPDVVAGFLRVAAGELKGTRQYTDRLRILDFACGYGAIGLLLRHDLRMRDLYQYYANRDWQPEESKRYWEQDRAFFAERRDVAGQFEIAGLDIAATAVAYGLAVGSLDHAFSGDLVSSRAGSDLRAYLADVDLVIESGAIGQGLRGAFSNVLADANPARRPWFLYCPRPDVDWTSLTHLWEIAGYHARPCNPTPVHYRRALSRSEELSILRDGKALGREIHEVMADGYLVVDLMLARPVEDEEPTGERIEALFRESNILGC